MPSEGLRPRKTPARLDVNRYFFPHGIPQDLESDDEEYIIRGFLCRAYARFFGPHPARVDNLPGNQLTLRPPEVRKALFGLDLPTMSGGSVILSQPDCAIVVARNLRGGFFVSFDQAISVSHLPRLETVPTIQILAPEVEDVCVQVLVPCTESVPLNSVLNANRIPIPPFLSPTVGHEETSLVSPTSTSAPIQIARPHTKGIEFRSTCCSQTITILPLIAPSVHLEVMRLVPPKSANVDFAIQNPDTIEIDLAIALPKVGGKVFVHFEKTSMQKAGERSRSHAGARRSPDDPFTALFFLLLPAKNWDCRVLGLDQLLAAYPQDSRPYPFQLEGIKFLSERIHALLADEMGLGKTVQAILAFRALVHSGHVRRILIVCPKSLLATWYLEVSRWSPELSATVAHGTKVEKVSALVRPHHVYITNYETVSNVICNPDLSQNVARIPPFDLLIIDEGQHLKNPTTKKAKAVMGINAERRWCLTGTPLENSFEDYRAVWRVIAPNAGIERLTDAKIRSRTKTDVLRREKQTVLSELPEKIIQVERVQLDERQRVRYDEVYSAIRKELSSRLQDDVSSLRIHVLAQLTKLKQICIFDDESRQSAKMDWIKERLQEMNPKGVPPENCPKALVFTQYPKLVWEQWELQKLLPTFRPGRYDGSMRDRERQRFPERFQTDENMRVAFVSLKAGGTGLTLTRASHVIFLDQWWNPAVMDQAAARIHRIGQKRACFVTALVAEDTIDERILTILEKKKVVFEQVMEELKSGKKTVADIERLENCLSLDEMLGALGLSRKQ